MGQACKTPSESAQHAFESTKGGTGCVSLWRQCIAAAVFGSNVRHCEAFLSQRASSYLTRVTFLALQAVFSLDECSLVRESQAETNI